MSEARKTPQSHFTGPVVIDPLTRIEGHLRIEVEVKDGRVSEARSVGTLYRGLKRFWSGATPRRAALHAAHLRRVHLYPRAGLHPRPRRRDQGGNPQERHLHPEPRARDAVSARPYRAFLPPARPRLRGRDQRASADPVKAAKICSSVSPRPASADGFKAVQAKLKAFVESGQLGPFTNATSSAGIPLLPRSRSEPHRHGALP